MVWQHEMILVLQYRKIVYVVHSGNLDHPFCFRLVTLLMLPGKITACVHYMITEVLEKIAIRLLHKFQAVINEPCLTSHTFYIFVRVEVRLEGTYCVFQSFHMPFNMLVLLSVAVHIVQYDLFHALLAQTNSFIPCSRCSASASRNEEMSAFINPIKSYKFSFFLMRRKKWNNIITRR